MLDEDQIARLMRAFSVAFPFLVLALLLLLIFAVRGVSSEIRSASEKAAVAPVLPAGIYICDGERCVIANSQNIDGVGKSK